MRVLEEPFNLASYWDRACEISYCASSEADIDLLTRLESRVLLGPIRSPEDAVAKLRAVELIFIEGERSDGSDRVALEMIADWVLRAGWSDARPTRESALESKAARALGAARKSSRRPRRGRISEEGAPATPAP
jgi:hypothetical protein